MQQELRHQLLSSWLRVLLDKEVRFYFYLKKKKKVKFKLGDGCEELKRSSHTDCEFDAR